MRVSFDADRISLRHVLEIFFHAEDATTLNRQAYGGGARYRSGICFECLAHEDVARAVRVEARPEAKTRSQQRNF